MLAEFGKQYGITFRNPTLLKLALTHRSYLSVTGQGPRESNERLEFLGDSVLGLVTSEYLYRRHPDEHEGQLTKTKSLLVSKAILSRRALRMGLGRFVLMSHSEVESGGRQRLSILADAFESVLGAIYLDQGFEASRTFIHKHLLSESDAIVSDKRHTNYKSHLQEYVQSTFRTHPVYRIRSEYGPDHSKHFMVEVMVGKRTLGEGRGHNKKEAEQAAARDALEKVERVRRRGRDDDAPRTDREAKPARDRGDRAVSRGPGAPSEADDAAAESGDGRRRRRRRGGRGRGPAQGEPAGHGRDPLPEPLAYEPDEDADEIAAAATLPPEPQGVDDLEEPGEEFFEEDLDAEEDEEDVEHEGDEPRADDDEDEDEEDDEEDDDEDDEDDLLDDEETLEEPAPSSQPRPAASATPTRREDGRESRGSGHGRGRRPDRGPAGPASVASPDPATHEERHVDPYGQAGAQGAGGPPVVNVIPAASGESPDPGTPNDPAAAERMQEMERAMANFGRRRAEPERPGYGRKRRGR